MRYLKVVAQDRSGNGKADTVGLYFYQKKANKPAELVHEVVAVDMTADGIIDLQFSNSADCKVQASLQNKPLLMNFAKPFFELDWFNNGPLSERSFVMFVEAYNAEGEPVKIRADFNEQLGGNGQDKLIYGESRPRYSPISSRLPYVDDGVTGIRRNGVANGKESFAIEDLGRFYMGFSWHQGLVG